LEKTLAEMLDEYMRLQIVANDHQIRAVISFASHIDIDLLNISIKKTFSVIPILNSCFSATKRVHYWLPQTNDFNRYIFIHKANAAYDLKQFLSIIPDEKGPQITFQVIRNEKNDLLIVTVNHMTMDGTGFKSYLYFLAGVYSGKKLEVQCRDRRIETLLKNISLASKIKTVLRSTERRSKNNLVENIGNPVLTSLFLFKITHDEYVKIKGYCNTYDVTINDFIISLFTKAIFVVKKELFNDITIQVMFDLRRYADKYSVSEYGNFASMESITIHNNGEFSDILIEIHKSMNKLKAGFPGIKNIVLMHLAFSLLPLKTFNSLLTTKIMSFNTSTSNLGVIDHKKLQFSGITVNDAYLLTSVKKQPAVQLSFSTFQESITLSILGKYSEENTTVLKNVFKMMKEILSEIIK